MMKALFCCKYVKSMTPGKRSCLYQPTAHLSQFSCWDCFGFFNHWYIHICDFTIHAKWSLRLHETKLHFEEHQEATGSHSSQYVKWVDMTVMFQAIHGGFQHCLWHEHISLLSFLPTAFCFKGPIFFSSLCCGTCSICNPTKLQGLKCKP